MGDGDFFKLGVADDDRVIVPGSDTRTEFLAVARFKIFFCCDQNPCGRIETQEFRSPLLRQVIRHDEHALLAEAQSLAFHCRGDHLERLPCPYLVCKQCIAAIQDVSDGTPLMLAERDFRVHAGKYDMLSVIRTGPDRVESLVVLLHKRFSPGRLFPYPLTESVFNGLLLLLGKGSGFLVQYALLLAIRILNGVKDARISQIQRIF